MSKPPMKVLWIFSTFGLDAPSRRFASIAGRLGDEYEHVIGSISGDFEAEALIPDGVNWRRVELPRAKKGVSVSKMWNFRKVLTTELPNLLITSNWDSLEWLMINRGPGAAPHIHFEDPFGWDEQLDADDAKRAWGRRRALPGRNRAFIAPTREIETLFTEMWGATPENTHYVPIGVDLELFPSRTHDQSGGTITLGSAGPLIRSRRFDRLIRMTATLVERGRNVRAVILGEGPEKAALLTEAQTAGVQDRIRFVGAARGCAQVFSEMDVYVAASEHARDASGILAAMASGVPIAGLEGDDLMEMVDPSNQLFIRPANDESGMIAAAELLVSDLGLRQRLGRANRLKAEKDYDLSEIAQRYDELFRDTAGVSKFLALPAPGAASGAGGEKKPDVESKPTTKETKPKTVSKAKGRAKANGSKASAAKTTKPAEASTKPVIAPGLLEDDALDTDGVAASATKDKGKAKKANGTSRPSA